MSLKKIIFVTFMITLSIGRSDLVIASDAQMESEVKMKIEKLKELSIKGKKQEAMDLLEQINSKYKETDYYKENKEKFMAEFDIDIKTEDTGIALIKMQNLILDFKKTFGKWPTQTDLQPLLDGWGNRIYWMTGDKKSSYDLIVLSAGADSMKNSGDELIVVWTEEDLTGYKDKKTGETVGKMKKTGAESKTVKALRQKANSGSAAQNLDLLIELDKSINNKNKRSADGENLPKSAAIKKNNKEKVPELSITDLEKSFK